MSLSTSSLRYLETRRYISISKEAPDISSSWHPAGFACFMPDAGNIPHLEGCLNLFESQKIFGQFFYGPFSLATQARQPDNPLLEDCHASQSYVLESYFHPENTEVGTLPSLGVVRVTCVENIQVIYDLSILLGPDWAFSLLQDLNFLKEAIDTHSSLHQSSKECSCPAYIACLMQATVSMSLSTSSLRYLESQENINFSKEALGIPSSWHSACISVRLHLILVYLPRMSLA